VGNSSIITTTSYYLCAALFWPEKVSSNVRHPTYNFFLIIINQRQITNLPPKGLPFPTQCFANIHSSFATIYKVHHFALIIHTYWRWLQAHQLCCCHLTATTSLLLPHCCCHLTIAVAQKPWLILQCKCGQNLRATESVVGIKKRRTYTAGPRSSGSNGGGWLFSDRGGRALPPRTILLATTRSWPFELRGIWTNQIMNINKVKYPSQ